MLYEYINLIFNTNGACYGDIFIFVEAKCKSDPLKEFTNNLCIFYSVLFIMIK